MPGIAQTFFLGDCRTYAVLRRLGQSLATGGKDFLNIRDDFRQQVRFTEGIAAGDAHGTFRVGRLFSGELEGERNHGVERVPVLAAR